MVLERVEQLVHIPAEGVTLEGLLVIPAMAAAAAGTVHTIPMWRRSSSTVASVRCCSIS
jgi:hypothetical protein